MLASALPIDGRAYPAPAARALAPVTAIALVAATADPAERDFIASLAGRTVTALVVGRSDTGRALVNINGRQVPVNAAVPAPGASVLLSFGEAEALVLPADNARTPAQVAATPPGLQLALTASRELAQASRGLGLSGTATQAAGGPIVELRPQALSLGRLAGSPAQPLQLGSVAAGIGQPAQWAEALGTMVRESGAFYESHLAAWTEGRYPIAQIRQEPQAAANAQPAAGHDQPQAAPATPGANTQPQTGREVALATTHTESGTNTTPTTQSGAPATDASGVPDALRAVVREQLHTLETRTLPFAIEPWPGQRADLVIAGEPDGHPGATSEPAWNTTLKLALPRLGNIDAVLTLSGDRLWLDLAAAPASADELDAASTSLTNAMQAAGVQMARVRVRDQVVGNADGVDAQGKDKP